MKLPSCNYRHAIEGENNAFRCAHPKVFSAGDVVRGEMCRLCTQHASTVAPKPLSASPSPPQGRRRTAPKCSGLPKSIAVVIPCHNYGQYLQRAIESVLAQIRPADEVLVVDDASSDDTERVARSFAERGVGYLRIDDRHSQRARRAGWLATTSDVLVFLDADDALALDYLACGLSEFTDVNVGLVYSDVVWFGDRQGKSDYPAQFDRALLGRRNFMHTGSLVRREALDIAQACDKLNDDRASLQDWLLWRRIVDCGWQARKQKGLYLYRRHADSLSNRRQSLDEGLHYYRRASLALETVTLFVPLSGRMALWPRMAEFLQRQSWPHKQTRLVLYDTGQNADFSRRVREWLAHCDYPDARHWIDVVGEPGLADRPRREAAKQVCLSMARIYNRLAREANTDYVWVVEDDVFPPDDACLRLLQGFDEQTASVSGAYLSRFASGYVAWRTTQQRYTARGEGLEIVGGNGFGCVVIRGGVLRQTVFTAALDVPAYDTAFYLRLPQTGLYAKVDWSVECEHSAAGVQASAFQDAPHAAASPNESAKENSP